MGKRSATGAAIFTGDSAKVPANKIKETPRRLFAACRKKFFDKLSDFLRTFRGASDVRCGAVLTMFLSPHRPVPGNKKTF
ncbi:hypothetical protein MM59RIKEN_10200 [Pusillibacter faecalis]|uniref:Uncharacterized protein n=1 Tax=Pusillibacter faecalis TaxID=2714358 RepID=A0A810QDF6_9FIRM|nr:hypothetical protein MM59RIKEN_10200 [Pusillibacter faecalis]